MDELSHLVVLKLSEIVTVLLVAKLGTSTLLIIRIIFGLNFDRYGRSKSEILKYSTDWFNRSPPTFDNW